MFQLEQYHGTKSRFTCPSCHCRNTFARYINVETGEYLSGDAGRCNRESKCGYHFTPKDYFDANPDLSNNFPKNNSPKNNQETKPAAGAAVRQDVRQPDYINSDILIKTLKNFERNSFVSFLFNLFPEDAEAVRRAVKDYFIGTTKGGKTVFWQIDRARRIRTGKIIAYDIASGKRLRDQPPTWAHSELERRRLLPAAFNLTQCFFGEHLAIGNQPIAIVEAEKTAVIASVCFPEAIWLACGAKQNLKAEKLNRFPRRNIILYPDADGFDLWRRSAQDARKFGLTVKVSSLIEERATDQQKADGCDLADYLIREQTQINEHNRLVDRHNAALTRSLAPEKNK